jgi:hydroxyethylthiazole kinase-like uncharacterized protein yjeF
MRQLEHTAATDMDSLMETAGLAIARRINQLLDGVRGKRLLILVGPGNNGGDGMVAARYLSDWGALATLYITSARRREDKLEECRIRRVNIMEARDDKEQVALTTYLSLSDLVLDSVFGIGNNRPLDGLIRDLFATIAEAKKIHQELKLVALDVPSGIDADDGSVDAAQPKMDLTLTLGLPKVGLVRFPAANYTGNLEVIDIGLPVPEDPQIRKELIDTNLVASLLPLRPLDSHKGTFGHLLVIGGSRHYVGAAALACQGGQRIGVGQVTLATPMGIYRLAASQMAETTYIPMTETSDGFAESSNARLIRNVLAGFDAAVLGPGLGDTEDIQEFVKQILLVDPPLATTVVIDADALNALAKTNGWWKLLDSPSVLTPHPGEFARLSGSAVETIQRDRIGSVQWAASHWNQVVVLKGAHTVIASPEGKVCVSPFANPALASAGTGDVLAGVIGGLIAQGLNPFDAAVSGVHIHGLAAEQASIEIGDAGMIASDLFPILPRILSSVRKRHEPHT